LRTITESGRPVFDESGAFKGYRGTGRDITRQREVEEKIRHMAHHDALTGLPNRVLLHDRIGQAIAKVQRSREALALLFIDLDRFKTVNDSLGHHVGDRLLKVVGARLEACTRGSDTIARIGGDEFVVLLSDLDEPEKARHVVQKVLDALSAPPPAMAPYRPVGGVIANLVRQPKSQLYLIGGALLMIATGLILSRSSPELPDE
jgi:diguanylate cyclase (GGDEF)-like protein